MFEILFSYYEKSDGGYDTSKKLELKKVLGKNKDVSLDSVAKFIFSQLSRRDIFICGTQIFEYKMCELNFKESKDGVVIKNKKFTFDGGVVDVSGIDVADNEIVETKVAKKPQVSKVSTVKVIREEVFGLDIPGPSPFKSLTKGKSYRIVKEYDLSGDYVVISDNNMELKVSCVYFSAVPQGIKYDGPVYGLDEAQNTQGNIVYGGEIVQTEMAAMPRR